MGHHPDGGKILGPITKNSAPTKKEVLRIMTLAVKRKDQRNEGPRRA